MLRRYLAPLCFLILAFSGKAIAEEVRTQSLIIYKCDWHGRMPRRGRLTVGWEKKTRTAVEAFQRMRGLEETGETDEKTQAALRPENDKPTLGRVDGFDQDEAECESDEGAVVLRGFLAS